MLALAVALTGCQTLQEEHKPPAKPAFALEVEGPDDVRELLQQHLELQRFREFQGLRDLEINRLIGMAPDNIRELLATLGYFSPDIEIERENRPGQIPVVRVKVQPGPATHVTDVEWRFQGDIATNPDADVARQRTQIQRDWLLEPGKRFRQSDWASAKTEAVRGLTARRYLAGKLADSQADVDPFKQGARLGLTLDSGPVYRFGGLQVQGLRRYDQTLMVERFARIERGSEYDRDTLLAAQQRLADSGYFDSVFLYVDPASDPQDAPVQVQVSEAKMQKVVLGVGYSTDERARLSAQHTYLRIPGLDWKATTKLSISQEDRTASIDLLSPPNEHYWRNSISAALSNTDYADLNVKGQSFKVGRTRTSDDGHDDLSYFVQLERNQESSSLGSQLTSATMLGGSWVRRRFDNDSFPTRGWGLGLDAGAGFTMSGKQYPFTRVGARALGFVPLPTGAGRIALRAQGAAVTARTEAPVPASLKFLTGGDATVRGYSYRSIGVTTDGVTVPGRYLALGSIEWQRPIVLDGRPSAWESLVFVDSGSVADKPQNLSFSTGVGVGARWRSPIGPFQISTAYGLKDKKMRLHLAVGFVF
ncbi:MAG: Translocation and assembly module subunit TamA [Paracidovorax wautersii]|uniref:Translocation and assembly module subunit TamA n=1 Tax=Paracidovorax wautersii TaxID=1177982 RepID=A0A7V8FPW3_9BURK|nr:MAG: Translocation and assembly module subunit TamA [Paracidovorax wautersii]